MANTFSDGVSCLSHSSARLADARSIFYFNELSFSLDFDTVSLGMLVLAISLMLLTSCTALSLFGLEKLPTIYFGFAAAPRAPKCVANRFFPQCINHRLPFLHPRCELAQPFNKLSLTHSVRRLCAMCACARLISKYTPNESNKLDGNGRIRRTEPGNDRHCQ